MASNGSLWPLVIADLAGEERPRAKVRRSWAAEEVVLRTWGRRQPCQVLVLARRRPFWTSDLENIIIRIV